MASFMCYGPDELASALNKISDIPEEVKIDALKAGGEIIAAEQKKVGEEKGIRDPNSNVHILDKIKVNKPKIKRYSASVSITFSGNRKRGKTKTRNAEIAFFNEFGTKEMPARPFISVANAKAKEKAIKAIADVIHDYIEKTI